MKRGTTGFALALVVCSAGLITAQRSMQPFREQLPDPPKPVFRTAVNYVEADVIVLDDEGKPVRGLTADDFEVTDSGARQTIADFSFVEIPVDRPEPPVIAEIPTERDVQANSSREGRLYVIVMDDQHIAAGDTFQARRVARAFIENQMGSNDLGAVIYTMSSSHDSQDVTSDRGRLVASVEKLIGSGEGGSGDGSGRVYKPTNYSLPHPPTLGEITWFKTITKLAEFVGTVKIPRRVVVLITEHVPSKVEGSRYEELVDTARRAGVGFYAIDPRGLDAEVTLDQGMFWLAEDTGGFAIMNTNNIDRLSARIVADNSTYYRLGYYSTAERRKGSRPSIHVRREGVHVRVRGGIAAESSSDRRAAAERAAAGSRLAVDEALTSAASVSRVPMKVQAGAYRGKSPKTVSIPVVVEVDIKGFTFTERNGRLTSDPLVVRYVVTDSGSKIWPTERATVDLMMRPDTFERVREEGVRVLSHLTLPPGRYQVRVAAGPGKGVKGDAGSVVYDLDVPDFAKAPLSMSSVLIASEQTAGLLTVRPTAGEAERWWAEERFADLPPTTVRAFASDDVLTISADLYEGRESRAGNEVNLRVRLMAGDGQTVHEGDAAVAAQDAADASGRHRFVAELPLKGIPSGRYVLQMEGRSSADEQARVVRNVEVRVK